MATDVNVRFADLCRVCATKTSFTLGINIFESEGAIRKINDKIEKCLPIKVHAADELPKMICENCINKLDQFYDFRERSVRTENMLLELLKELSVPKATSNSSNDSLESKINSSNEKNERKEQFKFNKEINSQSLSNSHSTNDLQNGQLNLDNMYDIVTIPDKVQTSFSNEKNTRASQSKDNFDHDTLASVPQLLKDFNIAMNVVPKLECDDINFEADKPFQEYVNCNDKPEKSTDVNVNYPEIFLPMKREVETANDPFKSDSEDEEEVNAFENSRVKREPESANRENVDYVIVKDSVGVEEEGSVDKYMPKHCKDCGKVYRTEYNLMDHIMRMHKGANNHSVHYQNATKSSGGNPITVPDEEYESSQETAAKSLTPRSKLQYESTYAKFMEWKAAKKIESLSEAVFLQYFSELSEKLKPSSVWAIYSQLRITIHSNHNIKIHDYSKVIALLKRNLKGFQSKKAKALSPNDIRKFLHQAPDHEFLAVKLALIFGIQGACRRDELCYLTTDQIEDKGNMILVKIPDSKSPKPRSFVIADYFYHLYKKYAALRPNNTPTKRFFLSYRNGKCSKKVIGVNAFGNMPKTVAAYLKLQNPHTYTGHTFRRTTATQLADCGADVVIKSEPELEFKFCY